MLQDSLWKWKNTTTTITLPEKSIIHIMSRSEQLQPVSKIMEIYPEKHRYEKKASIVWSMFKHGRNLGFRVDTSVIYSKDQAAFWVISISEAVPADALIHSCVWGIGKMQPIINTVREISALYWRHPHRLAELSIEVELEFDIDPHYTSVALCMTLLFVARFQADESKLP